MPASIAPGAHTVNTYLIVKDVPALIAFCTATFDARVVERMQWKGRVTHVQMVIGDSMLMAGEAPDDAWNMPSNIYVYVDDSDGAYARALAAGGESIMPPTTMFYGDRHGGVTDACGNKWWIATHVEDVSTEELTRRHAVEMERREASAS